MFVYKISWLPYICIIGGVCMIFSEGEKDSSVYLGAIIFITIGCLWLYFKRQNKESAGESNSSGVAASSCNTTYSVPVNHTPSESSKVNEPVTTVSGTPKFCRYCGTKALPGSIFCSECGNKL